LEPLFETGFADVSVGVERAAGMPSAGILLKPTPLYAGLSLTLALRTGAWR
jgi:hypothetical protein